MLIPQRFRRNARRDLSGHDVRSGAVAFRSREAELGNSNRRGIEGRSEYGCSSYCRMRHKAVSSSVVRERSFVARDCSLPDPQEIRFTIHASRMLSTRLADFFRILLCDGHRELSGGSVARLGQGVIRCTVCDPRCTGLDFRRDSSYSGAL